MLNDSKWNEIGENKYRLEHEKDGMIAILYYDDNEKLWELDDYSDYADEFKAGSVEEAMWRATVMLTDYYNRLIGETMKLRDHLPSLGELYDKAFNIVKE